MTAWANLLARAVPFISGVLVTAGVEAGSAEIIAVGGLTALGTAIEWWFNRRAKA